MRAVLFWHPLSSLSHPPLPCAPPHTQLNSYGSRWPNEAFLLLFGFSPDGNPADAVVLFPCLQDLVEAWARWAIVSRESLPQAQISSPNNGGVTGRAEPATEDVDNFISIVMEAAYEQPEVAEAAAAGSYNRLLVTPEGIDGRLGEAVGLISRTVKESMSAAATPAVPLSKGSPDGDRFPRNAEFAFALREGCQDLREFLLAACLDRKERLRLASASPPREEKGAATRSAAAAVSAQFRAQKLRILDAVMSGL